MTVLLRDDNSVTFIARLSVSAKENDNEKMSEQETRRGTDVVAEEEEDFVMDEGLGEGGNRDIVESVHVQTARKFLDGFRLALCALPRTVIHGSGL